MNFAFEEFLFKNNLFSECSSWKTSENCLLFLKEHSNKHWEEVFSYLFFCDMQELILELSNELPKDDVASRIVSIAKVQQGKGLASAEIQILFESKKTEDWIVLAYYYRKNAKWKRLKSLLAKIEVHAGLELNVFYSNQLATCYYYTNESKKALYHYKKALELSDDKQDIVKAVLHYNLFCLYDKTGETFQAQKHLQLSKDLSLYHPKSKLGNSLFLQSISEAYESSSYGQIIAFETELSSRDLSIHQSLLFKIYLARSFIKSGKFFRAENLLNELLAGSLQADITQHSVKLLALELELSSVFARPLRSYFRKQNTEISESIDHLELNLSKAKAELNIFSKNSCEKIYEEIWNSFPIVEMKKTSFEDFETAWRGNILNINNFDSLYYFGMICLSEGNYSSLYRLVQISANDSEPTFQNLVSCFKAILLSLDKNISQKEKYNSLKAAKDYCDSLNLVPLGLLIHTLLVEIDPEFQLSFLSNLKSVPKDLLSNLKLVYSNLTNKEFPDTVKILRQQLDVPVLSLDPNSFQFEWKGEVTHLNEQEYKTLKLFLRGERLHISEVAGILNQERSLAEDSFQKQVYYYLGKLKTKLPLMGDGTGTYYIHQKIHYVEKQKQDTLHSDLTPRQLKLLEIIKKYASSNHMATKKQLSESLKVSGRTINRDINVLLESEMILRIGQGRAVSYTLNLGS